MAAIMLIVTTWDIRILKEEQYSSVKFNEGMKLRWFTRDTATLKDILATTGGNQREYFERLFLLGGL